MSSRRRQRRQTLPPTPPSEDSALPRRRSSYALGWPRPKSSSRGRLSFRRRDSLPPSSPPPPPQQYVAESTPPYVPVRVLDFVTVPAVRFSSPRDALGPVDAVRRPPSYDLRQTSWDADAVDRYLDMESPMSTAASDEVCEAPEVFIIDDTRHATKLVSIVQGGGGYIDAHEEESMQSVSLLSESSSEEDRVPDSLCSAKGTAGLSHSRSASTTRTDPPSTLIAVREQQVVKRPCLLPKKVPSPVKYTFRPPARPRTPLQLRDRGESEGATVLPVIIPEMRRNSNLSMASSGIAESEAPTLHSVKAAVEMVDAKVVLGLAMGGMFNKKKRESDESLTSNETEYYEDEYTRFIQPRVTSPRRMHWGKILQTEGWRKMEARSHSELSITSSDDEFSPKEERRLSKISD